MGIKFFLKDRIFSFKQRIYPNVSAFPWVLDCGVLYYMKVDPLDFIGLTICCFQYSWAIPEGTGQQDAILLTHTCKHMCGKP